MRCGLWTLVFGFWTFPSGDRQHRFAKIQADDFSSASSQRKSDVPGATAKVQRALVWLRRGQPDQAAFPGPVQPKTLQIVHQVIPRRDRGKQITNSFGALLSRLIILIAQTPPLLLSDA